MTGPRRFPRRFSPARRAMLSAMAVLLAAGLVMAAGRPGVVRTKTGVVYDGIVEERETTVVINVRGIESAVPRDQIESIVYGDFETRWNNEYNKLGADDDKSRVVLGRRAFDERRYDLAEKALRDAQAINPNNAQAGELLRATINQRRLEQMSGAKDPAPATPGTANGAAPGVTPPGQYNTLTPDDVNRIKQAEVRGDDAKVRFRFEKNVLKRFWDETPALADQYKNYGDFVRAPQANQAALIISQGTAEMVKDVKVTNDPQVFVEFKQHVLPLVLRGCATSNCHGGENEASKRFALVTANPGDTQTQYTNYYVLNQTRVNLNKGVAENILSGGPTWMSMIDRTNADNSLLLQYGLPAGQADTRHPSVRGYTGVFRGKDDPKYAAVRAFIKGLNPLQPDYGISFNLERQGTGLELPTTLPTSLPTTQPIESLKNLMGN